MKELLRQQQEEVKACRAALARSEEVSRQLELEGGKRESEHRGGRFFLFQVGRGWYILDAFTNALGILRL